MDLARIQQALRAEKLDGWLFYDFRKSNPIAYQVLDLPQQEMYTRRWFYFVPTEGTPTAIVSAVESHVLRSLPGDQLIYRTWSEMHEHLRSTIGNGTTIAMEYSPLNAIPYVSRVDGGTLEMIRSFGVEVASSANLSQYFVAQLSESQLHSHREAGQRLIAAKDQLFAELGKHLHAGVSLNEYQVQQRFAALIEQSGLSVPEPPIVAVNANASNPHYMPTSTLCSPIQHGDLLLFDFWAHLPQEDAIYADYTWVAFAGAREEIPEQQQKVFEVVRSARDTGIAFVRERLAAGERVEGREVDDVTRHVIANAGYGDYFVHRTGHSITTFEHGNGANLDNFETQDARTLLPNTCCSVEPGIYLPAFGVRSEVNLLIHENDAEVTGGPIQQEIVPLL
ncbi:MAG: aminopeptidase P family protein [Ktedonobacteraceae bacterium]|nr:aminopeptidase P family protein [Ktedonobacteraceae bacterium]